MRRGAPVSRPPAGRPPRLWWSEVRTEGPPGPGAPEEPGHTSLARRAQSRAARRALWHGLTELGHVPATATAAPGPPDPGQRAAPGPGPLPALPAESCARHARARDAGPPSGPYPGPPFGPDGRSAPDGSVGGDPYPGTGAAPYTGAAPQAGTLPPPGAATDPYRRIALDGPGAVRLVRVDGRAVHPAAQFSLAHTARHAVAAVRRADADGPPTGLGVDAEDEWDTAVRNLHRFGTTEELALLTAEGPPPGPLHLWCAKEALAKATGLGFRVPPRRYRLYPGDGTPHSILLDTGEERAAFRRRAARVRVGTRGTSPPTAWAVAELSLWDTAHEGGEHS